MAMTSHQFTRSVSRDVFIDAFMQKDGKYSWPWEQLYTVQESTHSTEQEFSLAGLGASQVTGEGEPSFYADMAERETTTYNHTKYTLGAMISRELLEDSTDYVDFVREIAEAMADGQNYIVDYSAALPFNRAFNSSYPLYDSVELCGTHTLSSGDTLTNELTAASIGYDSVWLAINYFENTMLRQDGIPLVDRAKYIIYNPSKEKLVSAVLDSMLKPGTGDNDTNSLRRYQLVPIPCRHISTNYWFVAGENMAKDMRFFWRWKRRVRREADFDRDGEKFQSVVRFSNGPRDFPRIVGNLGA